MTYFSSAKICWIVLNSWTIDGNLSAALECKTGDSTYSEK